MIYGLIGYAGAGKTTVLNEMAKTKRNVVEVQLAKKLKDTCHYVFGVPRWFFDSAEEKERKLIKPRVIDEHAMLMLAAHYQLKTIPNYHINTILQTPREILQYVGTEILREMDPTIHLKWAVKGLGQTDSKVCVISDIRFPDELEYFEKLRPSTQFVSIYIARRLAEDKPHTHSSERHIPGLKERCDMTINNNGTMSDLSNQVKELLVLGKE